MDKYEKERELFDSFMKIFESNKISRERWLDELEKVAALLQKTYSSNKLELLKKINNVEIINYVNGDNIKMKSLNSYFQKRIQNLKNNSDNKMSNIEEKSLKFDYCKLIEKYSECDKLGVTNKIIKILHIYRDSNDLDKIINEKEFFDIKDNAKHILKFVTKNKKMLVSIIKFFQKQLVELKLKLSKTSIFSDVISNKKIETYSNFIDFKISLKNLESDSNLSNISKSILVANSDILTRQDVPILFLYTETLNEETNANIDDNVFMISFNFSAETVDIFIKSEKLPLSFAKIEKITEVSNSKQKFLNLEDYLIEEYTSCENISFFLNLQEIVDKISTEIKNYLPKFTINIYKDSRKHFLVYKNFFEKNKDTIFISNEKKKIISIINHLKIVSLNLILSFDQEDNLKDLDNILKVYERYKELGNKSK